MINQKFVDMLRCLDDGSRLELANAELLASINQAISQGRLKNRTGHAMEKQLDGLLVREDRKLGYPIIDGIPIMLADEAITIEPKTVKCQAAHSDD